MARDGSSSSVSSAPRAGRRPLARVGCALRGSHTYLPSRRLDGYETCAHCGHRRKAETWFPDPQGHQSDSQGEARLRPLALMGCTLRGYHNFMPSRRYEGYETCMQCGLRRKASPGSWFATPPPRPPSQAAEDAGPISTLQESGPAGAEPASVDQGSIDPRVLRAFLRQIDSGPFGPEPPSGRGRRRGAQPPQS